MKQIVVAIMFIACLFAGVVFGQNPYKVEGKTITKVESTQKQKSETPTGFTFKDKDKTYDVFISKNGRCYYYKVSSKTGNPYKVYLDEETSKSIAKQMGIEYKEKVKNN